VVHSPDAGVIVVALKQLQRMQSICNANIIKNAIHIQQIKIDSTPNIKKSAMRIPKGLTRT
jgi:hypothetical protein